LSGVVFCVAATAERSSAVAVMFVGMLYGGSGDSRREAAAAATRS
jgi:hypothetical protein